MSSFGGGSAAEEASAAAKTTMGNGLQLWTPRKTATEGAVAGAVGAAED